MATSVPDIEKVGELVKQPSELQDAVGRLLGQRTARFPGAQPVSFAREHLHELTTRDYYVCEKSDGIRCLLYFHNAPEETLFLIDRKNNYYHVPGLHFPRPAPDKQSDPDWSSWHVNTILDGELLWDTYPDGKRYLKYLVFDTLVMDGQSLLHRTLDKRLAYFLEEVLAPYHRLWAKFRQDCEANFAFRVEKKATHCAYGIEMMFEQVLPNLKHTSDGLIFTCRETPYKSGTDEHILKWKPAEENTIDFKLDLRFPLLDEGAAGLSYGLSTDGNPDIFDYERMPRLVLHVYDNRRRAPDSEFSTLHATPAEWEAMKDWALERRDGLDGQIVECHMDGQGRWRFNRFREDKTEANHESVARGVLASIEDAVTRDDLARASDGVRQQWKIRQGRAAAEAHEKAERAARSAQEAQDAAREAKEAKEAREVHAGNKKGDGASG